MPRRTREERPSPPRRGPRHGGLHSVSMCECFQHTWTSERASTCCQLSRSPALTLNGTQIARSHSLLLRQINPIREGVSLHRQTQSRDITARFQNPIHSQAHDVILYALVRGHERQLMDHIKAPPWHAPSRPPGEVHLQAQPSWPCDRQLTSETATLHR